MRAFIAVSLALVSLSLLSHPAVSLAIAQGSCRCKGCGCKGGPGWRGPDGFCVSQAKLADVCGSPAGTPCKQEAASRVCFGKSHRASAPSGGRWASGPNPLDEAACQEIARARSADPDIAATQAVAEIFVVAEAGVIP
jgi:hypothetical protein